ncbi:fructose-bisphosphate aldolase [Clostridium tetanomorphum DSM 665]|uniref:class II fructose-bisphosphate aldolase n=1 Tax=Clostridium tetanomorphum TaxID=1553 RepID=UPI00044FD430|nr:class II fructose-bisphosphate aldolase [Clostridium tetanomorphum]KAJ48818.1 fructose-bisphosphate aldolase [Clostridium tetanomorphum DSM 665]KAJ52075.1 fructose-bisphosphate aldolase [Clostridium tetanomorphum DSM 665]MBP1862995.1 fructose-bisphosphate aldolase class II [Clostridium tetanomorphum]
MPIVNMKELLINAEQGNYCIGAFSIANMEMIMGVLKAAEETRSPIILQIAEVRLKHSPLSLIGPVMMEGARHAKVPVAVHLDHGESLHTIKEALDLGFTSVMYDGSHLSLEENIKNTKKIISVAKTYGAAVEGEVGIIGRKEDGSGNDEVLITSLEDAKKFYKETGVDALAIAIGNAHGIYKSKPNLNFKRLKEINNNVKVPLVLHGGSGITEEGFKKSIECGIRKINVATATFNSVVKTVDKLFKSSDEVDYFTYHNKIIEAAYENVKEHIRIFGSNNKA